MTLRTHDVGLRERKKLDTRRALSDATLELAFERGLDNVTREDIAARAGVSLRTFSNYFTGKYDALAYRQVERARRGLEVLRQQPADEPLWAAVSAAVLKPFEEDGADHVLPTSRQLYEIRRFVLAPETKLAVAKEVFSDWVSAVAERTGTDPVRDMYPRLVVGALVAVAESALGAYIHADPPVHITTLLRQGFAEIAAGLPEPLRH